MRRHVPRFWAAAVAVALLARPAPAAEATQPSGLPPDAVRGIDAAAAEVLASTRVPGASIAVVRGGRIAYVQAYGVARIEPRLPASPAMRYAIGSISKQFTAAALLLLQEDGRLSLDDRVGKFLPELTRAGDITIRQLLSHTAGVQDYWPQDYVFPTMLEPVPPRGITDRWARRPLDYEPGSKWQYSNTGYVIAGRIVEQVSGKPFFRFLQERIFAPLEMSSVRDFDQQPFGPDDPTGYRAFALGPPRTAPVCGAGWLFGAGQLAMTAADLARWNVSIIERSLLSDASYRALETDTLLASGAGTQYGLGLDVELRDGRRRLAHGGEVSGFTAASAVYPDDEVAIVVLVNQDASRAAEQLADKLDELVFAATQASDANRTAQARDIFDGLQHGRLDRQLFTANANYYFSEQAVGDFAASLAPLGAPREFKQVRTWLRGGMTGRSYDATFADRTLRVWTYEMPDGRLEQFQVAVKE
jgi:CubicO group peptidase (beta-lactamase class C family)